MFVLAIELAAVAVLAVGIGRLTWVWVRYRGDRVITCPENACHAGVVVDAPHAARTALSHAPDLRLANCSRWPEKAGCGQECLSQIAAAPQDCLVRNILGTWYHNQKCARCGLAIPDIHAAGAQPAILRPDGVSLEWAQISADKLGTVLAASKPLCFACHLANTLVRERPDLVVARNPRTSSGGRTT